MSDYYILNGRAVVPSTLLEWGRWLEENRDKKMVRKTKVGDSLVSTVFLGLDHQWGGGPPLIFETLVFDGPLADEMDRYSTYDEAEAGHEAMVKRVEQAA